MNGTFWCLLLLFFSSKFLALVTVIMAVQAQLHPEILGLSMCGLQDYWMVNNPVSGFEADFCFAFQELPQQQNLFLQQQISSQNFGFDCNKSGASSSSSTCDNFLSMALSQSLDAHLEMQRQEVDRILQVQVTTESFSKWAFELLLSSLSFGFLFFFFSLFWDIRKS